MALKHFQLFEIVDPETYRSKGEAAWDLFNPEALMALDNLREFFGVPITINNWHIGGPFSLRGYRTPERAAELGASHSQHALGNAFDCDIHGLTADQARNGIIENKDNPLLQKIMRLEDGVSWVHFDLMSVPDRIHVFKT